MREYGGMNFYNIIIYIIYNNIINLYCEEFCNVEGAYCHNVTCHKRHNPVSLFPAWEGAFFRRRFPSPSGRFRAERAANGFGWRRRHG